MTSKIGKDENTSILKRTRLGAENSNPDNDNIDVILPNRNFTYHEPIENEENNNINQFMVVSNNIPQDNTFLTYKDYKDGSGVIEWISRNTTSTNFEDNSRKTIDLLDPGYILALKNDSNTSKYLINDKYEWVSLHASVSDIGLNQIAWNTNEDYTISSSETSAKEQVSKILYMKHNENDSNLNLKINYIDNSGIKNTLNKQIVINTETETNTVTIDSEKKMLKVNSVEISGGVNKNDIEFFFKGNNNGGNTKNSITTMDLYKKSELNCFDYNEQYYTDPQFNSFLNITSESSDTTDNTTDTDKNLGEINTTGENKDYEKELSTLLGSGGIFELEGGNGRKASIFVNNKSNSDDTNFLIKIENDGYLYQKDDELRFKNQGNLRDNYFFKVTGINDEINNQEVEYLQEFVKGGTGKSNTLKYALGDDEIFVIKNLNVCGSTQSNIIVKLIQISNTFSEEKLTVNNQKVLKEMYYYNRNNISENHDLNIFIDKSSEIYINIQKIIKNTDVQIDKNDMSTLNFSLNGIKYTTSE